MADSGRPGSGTPLSADDMIGSLATRVRELSLRVAQLEGELEAARRRIAVYESFDLEVQDSLAAALNAANQVRERARISAEAIAAEARAQRPALAQELDAMRTERDALRRAIDESVSQPRAAAPAPVVAFPMAEMRTATEALRGVFKELVAEIRALPSASPAEAAPPRPANSASAPAAPPAYQVPAPQQPAASAPPPPAYASPQAQPTYAPAPRTAPQPTYTAPPAPQQTYTPPPAPQPTYTAPPVPAQTYIPPPAPAQPTYTPPPPQAQPYVPPQPAPRPVAVPPPPPAAVVEDIDVAPAAAAAPVPQVQAPQLAPPPPPGPAPQAVAEPAREAWVATPSEPVGEVQVVLSPISSFPRLVELERRLQGMPVVRTVYARDFRNGVATLAIGLRHPMTVDEFATAVTKLEYPRLRIVSTTGFVLELRIDTEASATA